LFPLSTLLPIVINQLNSRTPAGVVSKKKIAFLFLHAFPLFSLLSDCPIPKCRWSNPQAHQQRHGPPELLGLVFLHLPTRADRAHFPAVCRQWRSSMRQCHLPPMSPMPWSVLPGGNIVRFLMIKPSTCPMLLVTTTLVAGGFSYPGMTTAASC
jgi:hypothetical protein